MTAARGGLIRTYISGVERGVRNPTVLILQDLSGVLGVRPANLLADVDGAGAKHCR